MSNLDLLSEEDVLHAAAQGWTLVHVFDLGTRRCAVQVLPLVFSPPFISAEQAGSFVITQARAGSVLAARALALVMASHNPTTRKPA